jgi:hypothetical protein
MKLYKVTVLVSGPPPEFGLTWVAYVLANNEAEAIAVGYTAHDAESVEAVELPSDKPVRITGSWL